MISALIYGTLGGLLGLLVFIAAPIIAAIIDDIGPIGDRYDGELRFRVAQFYFTLSMKAYQRVIATISPHNDLELLPSTWDRDNQAEKVTVGDDPEQWTDPKGVAARCRNVPFNLAFTDRAHLIHPFDAHVGNALNRLITEGRRVREFVVGDEENKRRITAHSAHANIPESESYRALDVQRARKALTESHEPGDIHKTRSHVEKSQAGYNERDLLEMSMVLIACFGGALAAWVIYSNTGDTESAVRVPVTIWGWFL